MFRRLRELGPGLLVPLAWAFVTAAHFDLVTDHAVFVAHVVMTVLLSGFAVTGWADMRDGVLSVWWHVIAVGIVVTLAGVAGFLVDTASTILLGIALGGWMILPAAGFVHTGRHVPRGAWIYFAGTACCLVGAGLYAVGLLGGLPLAGIVGLVLVGGGQTAGILDAALRY